MKRLLPMVALFISALTTQAQNTFSTMYVPAYNQQVSHKFYSDNSLTAGASGNQSWDFSTLAYSSTFNETYKDPATTGISGFSSSSNLSLYGFTGTSYFYSWSSTAKSYYGYQNYNGTTKNVYSEAASLLQLPMTYNQTTNDTYSGSGLTTSISGTASTTYDGYGTIKTFQDTYTDAVRIKTITVETQTNTTTSAVNTLTTESYDWYSLASGKLVFSVLIQTSENNSGSVTIKYARSYQYATTTNILTAVSNESSFLAGANPVSGQLLINGDAVIPGHYTLSLTDATGTVVMQQSVFLQQNEIRIIEVTELKNGFYVARLSSETGTASAKFIKE